MQRVASQSPAEAHGFALGLVFARVPGALAIWRREWYSSFDPADVLAGECRALLDRVFASVLAGDRDTSMQVYLICCRRTSWSTAVDCPPFATGARVSCLGWGLVARR